MRAAKRWSNLSEGLGLNRPSADEGGYRAFISHNRDTDGELAATLQRGLQRFAKPWFRTRTMLVYRDTTSLKPSADTSGALFKGLDASAYLILLASDRSALRPAVRDEVAYWLQKKGLESLIVGWTGGTLGWEEYGTGFYERDATALPPALVAAIAARFASDPNYRGPFYVDLRWASEPAGPLTRHPEYSQALLNLVAALTPEVRKEDLASEELLARSRTRRAARLAALALATLTLLACGAAGWALVERNTAIDRLNTAQSTTTGTEAIAELTGHHYDLAALLALEARRLGDTFQARDSLIRVLEDSAGVRTSLASHNDAVTGVALTSDGRMLASAGRDGRVMLIDTGSGRVERTLSQFAGAVTAIAFSNDGTLLATGTAHGAVELWSTASGRRVAAVGQMPGEVNSVALSPDGRTIAAAAEPGGIMWKALRAGVPEPRPGELASGPLAFSPDGRLLAVGQGSVVELLNAVTGGHERTFEPYRFHSTYDEKYGELPTVKALAFDGPHTLTAGYSNGVLTWPLTRGAPAPTLSTGGEAADSVAFGRGGAVLAVGGGNGAVRIASGGHVVVRQQPASVSGIAVSPDGTTVTVGDTSGSVVVWEAGETVPLRLSLGRGGLYQPAVDALGFSPNGHTLAAGMSSGDLLLWDTVSQASGGSPVGTLHDSGDALYAIAFRPDGHTIAARDESGNAVVFDERHPNTPPRILSTRATASGGIAFSPDGRLLTTTANGRVVTWDASRGYAPLPPLTYPSIESWDDVAYSKDGRFLAASGSQPLTSTEIFVNDVVVWPLEGGRPAMHPVAELRGPEGIVGKVAFSPTADVLVGAGEEGITMWDLGTTSSAALLHALRLENARISDIAFSPDGKTLIATAASGTVRFWDLATGEELGRPLTTEPGSELPTAIAVSPNGETIATGGEGLQVLQPLPLGKDTTGTTRALCRVAGANMSRTTWQAQQRCAPISAQAFRTG
jgi:WD40 repeat protein